MESIGSVNKIQNLTPNLQTNEMFSIPIWLFYSIVGVIVLFVLIIIYKKKESIIYFYNMARGRAVEERYLVYQGDEYDHHNAPKNQRKNDRYEE